MADLEDIDNVAPADSLFQGSVKINLMRARVDGLYTVLSDITAAEATQIEAIGTTTISATQWGYLGACVAGGGQLLAALTTSESTQLEAIGATTISATQWGYLGACAAGGGQLLAALTAGESTQLEAIGTTTISAAQWGYLGACTAAGGALLDDAAASNQRTTLGLGTIATQAADSVNIDGGDITGVTISGALTWSAAQNLGAYNHFINDTANTKMTIGLTINQGANLDEAFALKGSDIAHGITDIAETDTYFDMRKISADGGIGIYCFSESTRASLYIGIVTTNVTTKSAAGTAIFNYDAYKKDGTTVGANDADSNLLAIRTNGSTRFIFDEEGEMHSDAIIGIGDDWDEWDDLALASDLSRLPKAKFNEMMKYKAKDFEKAGLLTLSVDDEGTQHAFLKNKAMHQFTMCCFADIHDRLTRYEKAFDKLGINKRELLALET